MSTNANTTEEDNKQKHQQQHIVGGMENMNNHIGPDQEQFESNSMFGFSSTSMFTMSGSAGSEYTTKFALALQEVYQNVTTDKPKVSVLDRKKVGDLAYSTVIVSMKSGDKVNYYLILLAKTGNAPDSALEVINKIQGANKFNQNQQQGIVVWTPDDAVDSLMFQHVAKALGEEYPGMKNFITMDGLVIPYSCEEPVELVSDIAAIAYNACKIEKELAGNAQGDLNITHARKASPNTSLRVEAIMLNGEVQTELKQIARADFVTTLTPVNHTNKIESINLNNGGAKPLAVTAGMIECLPVNVPGNPQLGQPANMVRIRPHIILTNVANAAPTPAHAMLNVITGMLMTKPDMYFGALLASNSKHRDLGVLNLICNAENDPSGIGTHLNLNSPKLKDAERLTGLTKMFDENLHPTFSIDITSFGPQTHFTSMFSLAASSKNPTAQRNAAQAIIKACHWLTNGSFDLNYPVNKIFESVGINVPMGEWNEDGVVKDIRDIDLAFIMGKTTDENLIKDWVFSSLSKDITGKDPYVTKADIISKINPSAVILGKATRATFSGEFTDYLMECAVAAGLDAQYEPAVMLTSTQNYGMLLDHLGGGVGNYGGGFSLQNNVNGNPYQTQQGFSGYRYNQ